MRYSFHSQRWHFLVIAFSLLRGETSVVWPGQRVPGRLAMQLIYITLALVAGGGNFSSNAERASQGLILRPQLPQNLPEHAKPDTCILGRQVQAANHASHGSFLFSTRLSSHISAGVESLQQHTGSPLKISGGGRHRHLFERAIRIAAH